MLKSYFTIAYRNLLRHKVYTLINILGLAVGLTCLILIGLYIQNEYAVDQIHTQADRIYRVIRETRYQDQPPEIRPDTSGPLAPTLQQELPEVEMAVRNMGLVSTHPYVSFNQKGQERIFRIVDKHFFEMFDFAFLYGDPQTALQTPNAVVITKDLAQFYFGNTNPIGQTLDVANDYFDKHYTVQGVIQNHSHLSSVQFDMVTATVHEKWYPWHHWLDIETWRPVQTYILIKDNANVQTLEQKLQDILARNMGDDIAKYNTYHLQPLKRVHLYSQEDFGFAGPSDIRHIHLITAIAVFILIIACINFMNLSTARATTRAKEVGLRKVVGAQRWHLAIQFLLESTFIAFISLLLALCFVNLALPSFNLFVQSALTLNLSFSNILISVALTICVGLLSGCYPALLLSTFAPAHILKNTSHKNGNKNWIRKGLVIFQFAISIFLLISTGIVYDQVKHMRSANLGFDASHLIVTPIFYVHRMMNPNAQRLSYQYNTVKQRFLEHPNIFKATAFRFPIGNHGDGAPRQFAKADAPNIRQSIYIQEADEDFLDTFGIELISGRTFLPSEVGHHQLLINQTAAQNMGWNNPLDEAFMRVSDRSTWPIIGVFKDLNMRHLQHETSVQAIRHNRALYGRLALKVHAENLDETLAHMETIWKDYNPTRAFEFEFVDHQLDQMYHSDMRFGQTFGLFATLAIFLGCLGLFGLTSYTTTQRTKEIGIRKVLGASSGQVAILLTKTFIFLVIFANAIAWPAAYVMMNNWLQNYAHQTHIKFSIFVLSGLLACGIAALTVSYQAVKAARTNPTDALRYE